MFRLIQPILDQTDPEVTHNLMRSFAPLASTPGVGKVLRKLYDFQDPRLEQTFFDLPFRNPVGLAAGFDKYTAFIDIMPMIGMGYMEIGSISAQPRLGNAQPRLFRLPKDRAVINRMGLNNDGAEVTARLLQQKHRKLPLGINIVKTNDANIMGAAGVQDFVRSYKTLAPYADYLTLNISCPNTTEGKTYEDPEALDALLTGIAEETAKMRAEYKHIPPRFLKCSPDLSDSALVNLVRIAQKHQIDGYILTNTTTHREELKTPQMRLHDIGVGGLSGAPLYDRALRMVRTVYDIADKPFIIGVGGIDSADKAYAMIRAGASLVQIYTALVYKGPAVVRDINQGILDRLDADGFHSVSEAIGADKK